MYKIMANRFSYQESHFEGGLPLEPTIHVEENVIWEENSMHTEESGEFPTEQDETLPENMNETYMTATGDNSTQYFSVLESGDETILNDVSDVGVDNTMQEPEELPAFSTSENSEVVLYRVDGSDELYGVQIGHDESGNLQKYQFKVRQTEEGTLEALSDSIQILPMDSEGINIGDTEDYNEFQQREVIENEHEPVFVKQEQNLDIMPENDEYAEEEIFEDTPDVKEGILESSNLIIQQKRELFEPSSESEYEFQNGNLEETYYEQGEPSEVPEEHTQEEEVCVSEGGDEVNGNIPTTYHEQMLDESGEGSEELQEHYEELFVKESHIVEENGAKVDENVMAANVDTFLNDADDENESEDYETVEGMHITGDMEEDVDEDSIRRTPSFQRNFGKRKIIRNIIRQIKVKDRDNPSHFFYVLRDPEKGDVVKFHPGNRRRLPVVRTNPRSILKTSLPPIAPKPALMVVDDDKYDKRFAKSKEAQQARQFHNFIAQTKIIHAPVRQERLPRKQTIKPMERSDQEIVVQEVVVSSSGYIETSEDGVLKDRVPLKPTEFIQLSDTEDDDEEAKKRKSRPKKRKSSMIEITISDSEDDDPSVKNPQEESSISEEEDDVPEWAQPVPKRPRGRPPKNITSPDGGKPEVAKRPRGRPPKTPPRAEEESDEETSDESSEPEEEIIVIRIDNKCPKCPKSFPSEGSLRSHMQYHTYSSEMKYICEKCGEQFKNSALLRRHANAHITKDFFCVICKRVFSDQSQLIAHRRSHVKQQMFKVTNMPKDSPRQKKNMKCGDCGKVFVSIKSLELHAKAHKKLACATCAATFLSKLTLENHMRRNCVKSPMKRVSNYGRNVPKLGETVTNVKCDSCPMTFSTYTNLFKHKVSKHGLETPNKNSARKASQRKYSGVPANDRLRKAYLGLRSKLAEN